jgi:hypothetical protein
MNLVSVKKPDIANPPFLPVTPPNSTAATATLTKNMRRKQKDKATQTQAILSTPLYRPFESIPFEVFEGIIKEINIFDFSNFLCYQRNFFWKTWLTLFLTDRV